MFEARSHRNDGRIFVEEAYNIVAIAYNPVHPKVQHAADVLIECLNHMGEFYDCERFAQATLDSLIDPANGLNQESAEVAKGYYALANAISIQWSHDKTGVDMGKAELLARESYRINGLIKPINTQSSGASADCLGCILMKQGKLGHETQKLLDFAIACAIKNYGKDGKNTALVYSHLGMFYNNVARADNDVNITIQKDSLRQSKSAYEESVRISAKLFGNNHPETRETSNSLMFVSEALSMVQKGLSLTYYQGRLVLPISEPPSNSANPCQIVFLSTESKESIKALFK
jgi:hypothetical protein